ncbi:MAG: PIG-L family deacetylase [Syntrophobacterales bacterium]|jgi:LmbE family N-acetylglucosaminyl deacetylase|nr:PIG-L family deacetylase [Syntrophobacterales bacterium]
MNILAIGAHPDDIEVGCGGTLLKYARDGHGIYLLIMTKGDMGGDPDTRHGEQERSAELLTARELIWGGYRDTQLTENMNRLIHDIEDVLKRVKPEFTFVNFGDDTHQDHRALSRATVSATRYIKNVIFYEVPTTQNFSPTVFVDINETFHDKISLLLMHNSQVMKTNIEGLSIKDVVQSTAIFRGIQGRVRYAEGFVPLRLFINV